MSGLPQAHPFEVVGRATPCAIRRAPGYSGAGAVAVLAKGVEQHAFPGASFAVLRKGETVLQGAVGRFTYDESSEGVTLSTIFDLASVTKVVATTAMTMLLNAQGRLALDQHVADLLPEFRASDPRRTRVTVRMLLAHCSGLPAYERLFEKTRDSAELVRLAIACPLQTEPGARAEYSDIGFIILGELLQRAAGESLYAFCLREVFSHLGMDSTRFNPPQSVRGEIPPTLDDCNFRHRLIQGEVHDENAGVMGGVAGHAGLFSNTTDLMSFSKCLLDYGPHLFKPEVIDFFTRRQNTPPGTSRALGWDTPSQPSQSGKHLSQFSFGHLGYTGTSLWIDPEREVAIALLTNRTWPDNQSQLIKEVRPAFHDAVMEELLG